MDALDRLKGQMGLERVPDRHDHADDTCWHNCRRITAKGHTMTHADEIKYWADHPDGTNVWFKHLGNKRWYLTDLPRWNPKILHIVDDQWTELRKAQADGKQLQYLTPMGKENVWKDRELVYQHMKFSNLDAWRIEPEEPVYEWQWIWLDLTDDKYYITSCHYENAKLAANTLGIGYEMKPFEPSKREKK